MQTKQCLLTSVRSISLPLNSEMQFHPLIRMSVLQYHISCTAAAFEPLLCYSSIHEVRREWCCRTPPMPARNGAAVSCSPSFAHCLPPHHSVWEGDTPPQPEPDYLPMSPSPARVMAEEQHYTVMASVNTT
jgi:hypothetical protein